MKKIILLLFCAPLLLATTCDDDETIFCTTEAVAALNVTVRLGDSTTPTSEGVTVVATDGDYTETLQVVDATNPIFIGAFERQGNYIVTVSKEGYQTYTSEMTIITRDECHVIPELINVTLVAN
ncbi:PEGA domain-containing protein [Flavobacterium dankookense]|uniref:PEGA domain-containing protein n=1 Tax=Flavobacterium dankookense TaxID=706186 RepID=A0A4R6QDT1_9FLAO|nr:PEGA domain-containing protein [Flavobacterium dankookense]TDP60136.1 PEGA domain-containing protein [Flavobacterium dankookense]